MSNYEKKRLDSGGQQFHQYQQRKQSHLALSGTHRSPEQWLESNEYHKRAKKNGIRSYVISFTNSSLFFAKVSYFIAKVGCFTLCNKL